MKSLLTFLLAFFSCYCVSAQTESRLFGDFDNDGKITASDVTHLVNIALEKEPRWFVISGDIRQEVKVTGLSLSHSSLSISIGETTSLTATVLPDDATDKNVIWTSSDASIVSVDNGNIRGVGVGRATITAEASSDLDINCSCVIEVVADGDNRHYGHEYVDLGLPSGLLWATCNIGADAPENYGNYYAWGEVEPKDEYSLENYLYYQNGAYIDLGPISETEYDAAHHNWAGNWRMPKSSDFAELFANCTVSYTTQNGVVGYKLTSKKNQNTLFFPACGLYNGTEQKYSTSDGYYYSASRVSGTKDKVYSFYFYKTYEYVSYGDNPWKTGHNEKSSSSRYLGYCIRPVTNLE